MLIIRTEEKVGEMKRSTPSLKQLVLVGCTTGLQKSTVIFTELPDLRVKSV